MKKKKNDPKGGIAILSVSPLKALTLHLICGLGLGLAFWAPNHIYSLDLISHPSQTLRLISVFLAPLVILLYSHLRPDRNQCSYVKAVGRGLLALPAGAVVNALGATILGAPVGFEYFPKTLSWSLLMSILTFVPAACVFGSSWTDWHRIFATTKANESTDYMICLPAHGAVIGAWFGAWPMPLDWESPWQEWPICVTYGAIAGYLVGLVASLGCVLFRNHHQHLKEEGKFIFIPSIWPGVGSFQDSPGQQSYVNVLHPRGNNLYPEGMGAQVPGWSGIQPAPVNQFPKRLGVQLNDGVISQATREGVHPGTGGFQHTRWGNVYQPQDHGPNRHPTELLRPPSAMGRPQGGSSAEFNLSGLPYHAGQGVPISKVDVAPQAIDGPTSLKRRRPSRAPPTAPTCQRRRTLTQHSNQQLIAHQRPITIAPVPASSPSIPSLCAKLQGLEEPDEPIGENCMICKRNVMFSPEGPFTRPAIPPAVAVLPCGHVFHDHCLLKITPQDQSNNPPCIPCAIGET